jgi:hypothetical protein
MKQQHTLASVKRKLIGDSIERKKLVELLVKLVREDERRTEERIEAWLADAMRLGEGEAK